MLTRTVPYAAVGDRGEFDHWVETRMAAEFESTAYVGRARIKEQQGVARLRIVHAYPKPFLLAAAELRMRGLRVDPQLAYLPGVVADFGKEDELGIMQWSYAAATIDEYLERIGGDWNRLSPEARWAERCGWTWTQWQDLLYWNDDLTSMKQCWEEVKRQESATYRSRD